MHSIILSTSYFGPIQYFSKFFCAKTIWIEQKENYQKQSYRNRMNILGPNGIQTLAIPILRGKKNKTNIRDIKIDYAMPWPKNHWKTLESAYRSSPFFEFYEEECRDLIYSKEKYLFDLNEKATNWILTCLNLPGNKINYTKEFLPPIPDNQFDYRYSIHPKKRSQKPDLNFTHKVYHQVFEDRFGFIPNLSILDLLFNEGPNSQAILKETLSI
ncbi:MAG: WbqC family protein [Bacteroidota bacterium]